MNKRTIAHGYATNGKLTSGKWHRPIPSNDIFGRHYACGWNAEGYGVWQEVFEGDRPDKPYCKRCWPDESGA